MGENSKIEWTDHTLNPWIGCTKVSPGCAHCYAEGMSKRMGLNVWGPGAPRRLTGADNWRKPLKWDREAAAAGARRRVFCASMADVFDAEAPPGALPRLWALIRATPNLDWQLLTKRPERIQASLPPDWGRGYPNVWLGASVENQAAADARIPHLVAVPARVHFLSCEPLLGPVDLEATPAGAVLSPCEACWDTGVEPGKAATCDACCGLARIAWVIAGGESGPHHRPMDHEWAWSLRDQCAQAGAAFFFKQWGGRFPHSGGRHLDGRTWDEFPPSRVIVEA